MADAVGLGGLHDLGFYVCDLCQEQCQQNEELNALDCTFGNCPKDASVYHQDCLEAYLKSIRLERNRKTGYRCPRGSGKHSRFPDQCPGKISKSHPIHTRNECTKKKSKAKQPEPPQPAKQKGTKAAEAKAPAKGGAGAAAACKATAGAAKHAAAPAAMAAAPAKVQRAASVVSKEQQLKDAKAAFRQELGLKASPLGSRASSLRPAQGAGVGRTASAGYHGVAWSQGGSRPLAASGPTRSASDGSSSSTTQSRGKAQQQCQRSPSPPPINSEAVFPTVAAAATGHEAKQPVAAQVPQPQGAPAGGQRMQTSWVKVAGADQALSPRGPGDESIKAFQPTAAAQGAPPPPGTPSPAQLKALQPRGQAGVLAAQSPQSRRSIGRTVPLDLVHPRSGLSSESPSPRTSESGRLSRSQRKSLRRAERKPGPGNGCSDTVSRSMEAMRLSPVDEPGGDLAAEGGGVKAPGHFEAVAEGKAAAAALGPEPSGMFGDLEGWAGDHEQGDASLPEHDSSEEEHSQFAGSLAYQQCVQALTFRKAQLQVHQLQQLGFQEYQAIAAVQRWGDDVQNAVTWLLEGSVRSEQEAREIMETQSEPFLDISEELAHVREAQTWVKGPPEHLWAAISACKGDLDTAVALLLQQQREQEELALPGSHGTGKAGVGLSPHLASPHLASPTNGHSLSLFHNAVHTHTELLPGEQAAQGRGPAVSPFASGLRARPLSLKLSRAEHTGGLSVTPPDQQLQGRMSARTSLDGFGAPPRLQGYQTSGDYSGLGMDSVHSSQNLGLFEGSPSWGAGDSPATPATGYSLFAAGTGGCAPAPASNGYTLGADPASTLAYGGSVAPGAPSLHSPGMRPASAAYASTMGSPGGRVLMQPQAATPTGVHFSTGAAGQHFLQVLGSPCDGGPAQGAGRLGSIQSGQQRVPVFQGGFSVHPQRPQSYVGQHYRAPKRDVPEAALLAAASVDREEPSTAPAAHSAGDAQELNMLMASLTCR